MRHFYLSASFISIPDPVSGLKAGAYYIMWRSGKITRFWHCIFFYRFRKKFPTLRDKAATGAPEILRGQPVTPAADIYSLGRVLTELSDAMSCRCSRQLRYILEQACAADPADRCQEACDLKAARFVYHYQRISSLRISFGTLPSSGADPVQAPRIFPFLLSAP